MKRTLVIVAALAVSACGPSTVRSATEINTGEPPESAPEVSRELSIAADQSGDVGTEAQPTSDGYSVPTPATEESAPVEITTEVSTTTTQVIVPTFTSTTTTVPDINLDFELSELEGLLDELDSSLSGLGSVMNQSEGEITP